MFAKTSFSWNNKLQDFVALSSVEVENYATRVATKEVICIKKIMEEMRFLQKGPKKIYLIAKLI